MQQNSDLLRTTLTCLFLCFLSSWCWVAACPCVSLASCFDGCFNTPFLFLSSPFVSAFLLFHPCPLPPSHLCRPTCHSLLLFLKTSSSSGTQRDRSVSGSPWCNTTTVTSTLCSLCTTSPARPASAACPPGWRSAGRTRWVRTSPGGYHKKIFELFLCLDLIMKTLPVSLMKLN